MHFIHFPGKQRDRPVVVRVSEYHTGLLLALPDRIQIRKLFGFAKGRLGTIGGVRSVSYLTLLEFILVVLCRPICEIPDFDLPM